MMESNTWILARTVSAQESPRPGVLAPSFEQLFVAEYPRVVAIAERVLSDRAESEDVAQEVFLAFHQNHLPQAHYAGPWLHRAAWHSALNRARSRRRRQSREEADFTAPESDDPQALAEKSAQREQIRVAMSRLPDRSAAVLSLRYAGLSYAEVARAMEVGIGQVGTMLRRAEARLRKEVEKCGI